MRRGGNGTQGFVLVISIHAPARGATGVLKSVISYFKEVIRINGLKSIVTATHRNIKPFMRKWKMHRLEKYDYDYEGRHYYVLQTDIDNLRG